MPSACTALALRQGADKQAYRFGMDALLLATDLPPGSVFPGSVVCEVRGGSPSSFVATPPRALPGLDLTPRSAPRSPEQLGAANGIVSLAVSARCPDAEARSDPIHHCSSLSMSSPSPPRPNRTTNRTTYRTHPVPQVYAVERQRSLHQLLCENTYRNVLRAPRLRPVLADVRAMSADAAVREPRAPSTGHPRLPARPACGAFPFGGVLRGGVPLPRFVCILTPPLVFAHLILSSPEPRSAAEQRVPRPLQPALLRAQPGRAHHLPSLL